MTAYFAAVGSGETWTGATLHADRDCSDDHLTPLSEDAIDTDACGLCEDCVPLDDDSADGSDGPRERSDYELIMAGICPWCSDYEGDHVGQHASSAHPEKWDQYKSD